MAQVNVPFSYLRQVGSPAQSALQGYEQGLQMQASRLQAAQAAEERILDALLPAPRAVGFDTIEQPKPDNSTREKFREKLRNGDLEDKEIEIEVAGMSVQVAQLEQTRRHVGVIRFERAFTDGKRSLARDPRVLVLASLVKQPGQRLQAARHGRVIRPETFFSDANRSLGKEKGLGILRLVSSKAGFGEDGEDPSCLERILTVLRLCFGQ